MNRVLTWTLFVFLIAVFPASASSRTEAQSPSAEFLAGEELLYDISFLWFDRLATGFLKVEPAGEPDTWRVELSARTLGIAAWLTRDREQSYVSIMRRERDGRMRALEHSSSLFKGTGKSREGRVKRYRFDYANGKVDILVERPGKETKLSMLDIDGGDLPNDILTAYMNLRLGALGPLTPGRVIKVPTLTRKGRKEMVIEILSEEDQPKQGFFPKGGVLCKVTVDQEVFRTGGGYIYTWFDPGGKPRRGVVENVLGMGDVRGVPRYQED